MSTGQASGIYIITYILSFYTHVQDGLGLHPLMYTVQWFLCLFTFLPCWDTVLLICDLLLLEGQCVCLSVWCMCSYTSFKCTYKMCPVSNIYLKIDS